MSTCLHRSAQHLSWLLLISSLSAFDASFASWCSSLQSSCPLHFRAFCIVFWLESSPFVSWQSYPSTNIPVSYALRMISWAYSCRMLFLGNLRGLRRQTLSSLLDWQLLAVLLVYLYLNASMTTPSCLYWSNPHLPPS